MSKIEWTEKTWNPIVGCSVVSPGCTNCYAMKMAARLEKMLPPERRGDKVLTNHYSALTQPSKAGPVWTGRINRAPEHILLEPLRRKKPTMYFVNSMSDLFHESVPDEWILKVLDVIRRSSYDGGSNIGRIGGGEGEHTYQVLTKRSGRMLAFMSRLRWDGKKLHLANDQHLPLVMRNLWLGVSAEDQTRADERIPDLLATPAAVRFVSAEPLLGPINFTKIACSFGTKHVSRHNALIGINGLPTVNHRHKLDWIIVGGESGPGARPMHPDWARSIRDQCNAAGVAFFFKQWGQHAPNGAGHFSMISVGKKAAGRLLDGREWNEMPGVTGKAVAA